MPHLERTSWWKSFSKYFSKFLLKNNKNCQKSTWKYIRIFLFLFWSRATDPWCNTRYTRLWRRGVVVITTAQLHSTKPELRFCAGSNRASGVSEIRDGEGLWQWSRLEIRLKAFCRSTIPQKQFIIITRCKPWWHRKKYEQGTSDEKHQRRNKERKKITVVICFISKFKNSVRCANSHKFWYILIWWTQQKIMK